MVMLVSLPRSGVSLEACCRGNCIFLVRLKVSSSLLTSLHILINTDCYLLMGCGWWFLWAILGFLPLWWSAHELLKKLILGANKRRRAADIQNIIITANNSRPKLAPLMNPLDHQIDMIDSLKLICALLIVTLCQLRCDIIELDFSSSILASPRQAD